MKINTNKSSKQIRLQKILCKMWTSQICSQETFFAEIHKYLTFQISFME